MTGNLLLDSLISLGAIAVMVGFVWRLFGGSGEPVSEGAARDRLAFDEPDFHPAEWLFDADGYAALATDGAGEFAIIIRKGDDLATRRFAADRVDAKMSAETLVLRFGDPGFPPVRLRAPDAADWAQKLRGL
ncbi:MAG: hypothetical protein AAFW81_01310 [Pseudomonadota bacterium]